MRYQAEMHGEVMKSVRVTVAKKGGEFRSKASLVAKEFHLVSDGNRRLGLEVRRDLVTLVMS